MKQIWQRTLRYRQLDEIEDGPLRDVLKAWMSVNAHTISQQTEQTRVSAHLPVAELASALPYMAMVELNFEPFTARYLIFGPALRRLLGRNPEGQLLSDVYAAEIYAEIETAFLRAVQSRQPGFYTQVFTILGQDFGYNRLIAPLGDGKGGVERLVIALKPVSPWLKFAHQWQSVVERADKRPCDTEHMLTTWQHELSRQPGSRTVWL